MARYILGLHASHNASACIGDESQLIYAVQEERLTGEKNFWGFPRLAVKACLDRVGIGPGDLLATCYGGNQVLCRYHTRDDVIYAYRRQATMVGRLRQRVAIPLIAAVKPNFGQGRLKTLLAESGFSDTTVSHYDHHLTHAATAYYGLRQSPQDKYLVLTCDGAGDRLMPRFACGGVASARKSPRRLKENRWVRSTPGSLSAWASFRSSTNTS